MTIMAIIPVRMTSRRLPGKALHVVAGKPLLQYLLDRLRWCDRLDLVVVATSDQPEDTEIATFCEKHDVPCHRGSLGNVAQRLKTAIEAFPMDAFVRVNGDSPLIDQRLITRGIDLYRRSEPDLVTNVMPRTFPPGQSVEVLKSTAFLDSFPLMTAKGDLEHVTPFFYKHPRQFTIVNFTADRKYPDIHLAVDTPAHLDMFSQIVHAMRKPHWSYSLEELVELYHAVDRDRQTA